MNFFVRAFPESGKKTSGMRALWPLVLVAGVFSLSSVQSAVRQRTYTHDASDRTTGTESIVHWDFSSSVKLSMHNWGAGNLGKSSTIDFLAARSILGAGFQQWLSGTRSIVPNINLDLDSDLPYETSSGCETTTTDQRDGINNVLFTSKINSSCAEAIPDGYGIIGVTKVRYAVLSGQIVEADFQFDDTSFKFTASGPNDLDTDTVNLNDVVTHEIGHFFGLDHSSNRESSMIFSLAEDLQSLKDDDFAGLFSLYPPSSFSSEYGTLKGSLTDSSGNPVFGAVVFALNPRSMRVVASELSDVNGAFQFCAIPRGPYVLVANRYKPYGKNIHDYYSGDGDGGGTYTESSNEYCYNPSCEVMDRKTTYSLLSDAPSGIGASGGLALRMVNVDGTQSSLFVNLTANSAEPDFERVGGLLLSPGSTLQLDEPRWGRLRDSNLALDGSGTLSDDVYSFKAPSSGSIIARTASLRLFSRVKLKLDLYSASGLNEGCTDTATVLTAEDPAISCSGLTAGATYYLKVSGEGVSCREIPGNFYGNNVESCEDPQYGEDASSPVAFYVLNVFDANDEEDLTAADPTVYDSYSKASTRWSGMPTCSGFSATVSQASTKEGSCCGSLGNRGPDAPNGPQSFLLGLLLSPLLWFLSGWSLLQLKQQHLRRGI